MRSRITLRNADNKGSACSPNSIKDLFSTGMQRLFSISKACRRSDEEAELSRQRTSFWIISNFVLQTRVTLQESTQHIGESIVQMGIYNQQAINSPILGMISIGKSVQSLQSIRTRFSSRRNVENDSR